MSLLSETHGGVQERTQPTAAVTRFSSLGKKEFTKETDSGKQKEFIKDKDTPEKEVPVNSENKLH